MINYKLESDDIQILIESYKKKELIKNTELQQIKDKIKDLEKTLVTYLNPLNETQVKVSNDRVAITIKSSDGYSIEWSWVEKVKFCVKDKPLTSSEIADIIASYETHKDRETIRQGLAPVLSRNTRDENSIFTKYLNDKKEFVYTLSVKEKAKNDLI